MAQATINRGTTAGDGTGETAYVAFGKVNANFTELYGQAFTSTVNPASTDNTASGCGPACRWLNTTTGASWVKFSESAGVAVWTGIGLTLIQEVTTAASQSTVTLTPAGKFRDLFIVGNARSTKAAASDFLLMQFNGDTAANYAGNDLYGTSSAVGVAGFGPEAFIRIGEVNGDTATASFFMPLTCEIPGYSQTLWRKTTLGRAAQINALNYSQALQGLNAGMWDSSAAITSVLLKYTADNHKDNSMFRLYGRP